MKQVDSMINEYLRLFFDGTFEQDADAIERYFTHYAIAAGTC